ncbi:hypothetical protein B0H19DRAFT_1066379 [Mycena capillaripes]|nr:hypothetical protein B0H19DRAFT_1066379 [Mycena capillaripes]
MNQPDALYSKLEPFLDYMDGPSADDTPRTKNAWERFLQMFHATPDGTPSPEENSDVEPDADKEDDEEEEEEPEADAETAERAAAPNLAVIKRAQKILATEHRGPVASDMLAKAIAEPPALIGEKAEDHSLGWLLRGYQPHHNWVDYSAVLNLSRTEASVSTTTYLASLIHKMETIKCAREWNQNTGPGSGSFRRDFNIGLFQREYEAVFRNLTPQEKKAKMIEFEVDFKLFKKAREDLVTARNRLLFALEHFGSGVLIDPFFSVANLGQKRTKKFKSLLDALIRLTLASESDDPNRNRFHDLEEKNRGVLYMLTSALCSSDEERDPRPQRQEIVEDVQNEHI